MALKIYFAGSIRGSVLLVLVVARAGELDWFVLLFVSVQGGRQDAALYQTIIQHLQEHYGTVLTEHVGHDITDMGLPARSYAALSFIYLFFFLLCWRRRTGQDGKVDP